MIRVEGVSKRFGALQAVDNCSLEVAEGSITGIIGPNGAGKSTLFNVIAGETQANGGRIYLNDQDITGLPPHRLFDRGLLRTFQIAREFHRMTVLENLLVAADEQLGENLFNALFRPGAVRRREEAVRARADDVMAFVNLTPLAGELAGNLSGGQKKLLELGRVMMRDARVVLLDEIGAGVNRTLLRDIADRIRTLNRERGYTFCIIEHDMDFIADLCSPVIVMAEGRVLASGTMEELRRNQEVIDAYLGGGKYGTTGKGGEA